jgi:transcriptional regulator with GAF, ATPase, and Fis domain
MKNSVAIVTGASRGIGPSTAVRLARDFSAVVVGCTKPITLEEAERRHIRRTLEQTHWVVSGPRDAALRLGLKRSTLYWRMQKLGISKACKNPTFSSHWE